MHQVQAIVLGEEGCRLADVVLVLGDAVGVRIWFKNVGVTPGGGQHQAAYAVRGGKMMRC